MQVILHGGYSGAWEGAGEDYALFQKLIDAAEQADKRVMISFLAYEKPTDWPYLDQLKEVFHTLNPDIQLVIAGRDNFRELLPRHQVLFLQGGHSRAHEAALAAVTKEELMHNKILLAGSSSGAMLLSQYGYSRSSQGTLKGKGIVDLAVMPHANAWPVQDYLPELHAVTTSSILLLNELQMIELSI